MSKKRIGIFIGLKGSSTPVLSGWRNMENEDVRMYFKMIRRSTKNYQTGNWNYKKKGEYCERCGITIGKGYKFKETMDWKGFGICEACLVDKQEGRQNTPDLEDFVKYLDSLD